MYNKLPKRETLCMLARDNGLGHALTKGSQWLVQITGGDDMPSLQSQHCLHRSRRSPAIPSSQLNGGDS